MYTTIRHIEVFPDRPVILADADSCRCRLCGRREPAVTFRSPAHVFPKYMGITPCTSLNICDECQRRFPFPSSKDSVKTAKTTTTLTTTTTSTTLLRIALTVVPEDLLPHLDTTLRILRGDARPDEYTHFPVNIRRYSTSIPYLSAQVLSPIPMNSGRITEDLPKHPDPSSWEEAGERLSTPSLILLITYADTSLEIPIPGCDLDRHLLRTTYSLPILPGPHDAAGQSPLYSDLFHPWQGRCR